MPDFNIYSSRCWIKNNLCPATLSINGGKIKDVFVGKKVVGEGKFIDAGNDVVMPGVIDAHVHINEPGRSDWEGFETATNAAAAGGTTTLIEMPLNSSPVVTSKSAIIQKINSTKNKIRVNCGFYGGLIPGNQKELGPMISKGAFGIKSFLIDSGLDEFPHVGEQDVEEAMKKIDDKETLFLFHCELDDSGDHSAELREKPTSYKAYLKSRPKKWENDAIDLVIGLSNKYDVRCHIVHLSSSESITAIQKAKARGVKVSVETCPHYLIFNAEDIPDGDTGYKCAPPIRERNNNQLLKEAIKDGTILFLCSDHSPAPPELKEIESGNLQKAWGGIGGLQFLLSASWTALKEIIELEFFIPLLTQSPARFLGIEERKGALEKGFDADIVIWSPEEIQKIESKNIQHRHKSTPYEGMNLFGIVRKTIVNGVIVFENEKITDQLAGKVIYRDE